MPPRPASHTSRGPLSRGPSQSVPGTPHRHLTLTLTLTLTLSLTLTLTLTLNLSASPSGATVSTHR